MRNTPDGTEMPELSDDELLQQARSGSTTAFAALWRRHAGVAYSVAQTFRTLDADDIVSEAFTRVLEAIQASKGPHTAFRAYLTMTVRNVGRYQFNRQPAVSERERDATDELAAPSSEDIAVEAFEQSATAAAFLSLPTRWQEVLWYTEVDGLKPRTISTYLGIPANAVSALAVRAKRALRDAWITAQLATARTPECAAALTEMGAYTRGALSKRAQDKLNAHLATCPTCPAALQEAERLSSLTLSLLPVFAGAAGASAYSGLQPAPVLPEAALIPSAEDTTHGAAAAAPASVARTSTPRRPLVAAAWVTGAVLLVGAGVGATLYALREDPQRINGAAHSNSALPPAPSTAPTSFPAPAATPAPTTTPITMPSAPDGEGAPNNPTTQPDQNPPGTTTPPAPPEPPAATPLGAPAAVLQQPDARLYPHAQGTDARPKAKVELLDETGAIVGTTTANGTGSWNARVTAGGTGTHTIRARQAVGSETSASSAPMSYTVTAPPAILSPSANQTVSAAEFLFSYAAPAGTVMQREIEGVTARQTITTPANGIWREYFTAPPGTHTVNVRHYDPRTGDYGPTNAYSFTAQ